MQVLNLSLFGRFEAKLNGKSMAGFRTIKVQALLIYLATEPTNPHRRETLTTLLWPGMPERSARQNLRQIMYNLRRALPDLASRTDADGAVPLLLANRQTIQLNPQASVESDIAQFSTLIRGSQTHDHLDLFLCHDCQHKLETAVSLYRGNFLDNFYLDDSNAFEEWAEITRQTYRRQALDTLETITAIKIRQTAYAEARAFAERQLEIDDLRESGYRQLMKILALNGQRSEGVALYDNCRRLLAEELGMAPSARTTEIYEQIRAGALSFETQPTQAVRGFDLKEKIGEGAYGTIHRAIQPTVGREVAVKVIRRKYADDPDFIRRFEAEAQTIARLEHPYIVPLYDYWREPDGAFLVMRLLRGGNLLTSLESGAWAIEPTIKLLDQISSALSAAHRQGVVHRDIKPANILFDEAGNAYLSDFGIAKRMARNHQLTAEGGILGTPDYISPEQLRSEPVGPAADLYSLGAVLYEMLTGERPFPNIPVALLIQKQLEEPIPPISASRPDLPRRIDDVIQLATAKQPANRYPSALAMAEAFRQAAQGADGGQEIVLETAVPTISEITNPYKGLRAFQEADAADYYGRETVVEQLVTCLDESRFLAVVGPSGSGKSSLVKAGLIPALRQEAIPGSDNWFVAEMVPGDHPLEELELALLPIAVNPPPSLLEPMQRDERGLLRTIRRILPDEEDAQLLLVIDQFEELFTLVDDDRRRLHFLNSLLAALNAPRSPLRVVVTMRADFYDRPLQIQPIADLFKQHTEIVLPLSQEELTWAIREPARRMGVGLEDSVVTAMVTDVIDQPGALPLLQYALTELFDTRQNNVMSLAAYQSLGGVSGALAQRAEELFASFDEVGQEATRQLFLRLVTLGEGVEDTRRRVRLSELEALSNADNELPITDNRSPIPEYGRYRLLTFDNDPTTREPTVEVAHEALLREWPRLRRWLDQSRDDVRLQRQLASFVNEWATNKQETGFLLRGSRLDLFAGWAATMDLALTSEEQAFLDASVAAREQRAAEEQTRQQRELETAQRLAEEQSHRAEEQTRAAQGLRRRAYYLVGALAVALILAVVAVLASQQSSQNAETAQTNANRAATSEAEAVTEANQRATAQAVAGEERDLAISAQETAVAAGKIADELREAAQAAEAVANEERLIAEEQARIAFSRELAAAAIANLDKDPERSVLLALHALSVTYSQEAEEVLHRSVPHLRVLQTMIGHEHFVRHLDYSADGALLATTGNDGTARVWETATGQELLLLDGHDGERLGGVEMSNDGTFIATSGADGTAKVWDAATGELLHTLSGHLDNPDRENPDERPWVGGLDISPDSKLIATGSVEGTARLWDAATGAELMTITLSDENVNAIGHVRFSPDGAWLAIQGGTDFFLDDIIQIVDVATGAERAKVTSSEERAYAGFAFHPDGTMLLLGDAVGNLVSLWDIESAAEVVSYPVGNYTEFAFNPDGSRFATADPGGGAHIWDLETGQELLSLSGHQNFVQEIQFSPDGTKLATASWDNSARIWDLSPGFEVMTIQPFQDEAIPGVVQIAFNPDGSMVAFGGYYGALTVWDPKTGESVFNLPGHEEWIGGLFFSPDGTRLASASDDRTIKIWDMTTGELLLTMTGHEDWVNNLAYSPDGTTIATIGHDGRAFIWDATTGQTKHELPINAGGWGIAYSPDGTLVAMGLDFNILSIWDVGTGQLVQEIDNVVGADDVHFSPDGKYLITAGYDGIARFWNMQTGTLEQEIIALQGSIMGSDLSPDGSIFAATGREGIATIWEVQSGERLLTLEGATSSLLDAEFSPDGSLLVTADGDGNARFYTLSLDELVAVAESRLSRSLTEVECQEYLHLAACPVEE